jgi:hypothetical protein
MRKTLLAICASALLIGATALVAAQLGGGLMFPGPGMPAQAALPSIPSGMNLWYSADCITYTSSVCGVPSTGSTISSWADRSGNANNLSLATGTCTLNTGQINGYPAVTFSSCQMNIGTAVGPGGGAWTIFAVEKLAATGNSSIIGCASGACPDYAITTNQLVFVASGGTLSGTAAADTSWHQINVYFSNFSTANTYQFRRDRAADGSGTPGFNAIAANTQVGANNNSFFFNGQLAELIYYNTNLTGTQITQVETYLNAKYNL